MTDEKVYRTAFVISNTGHDFSELLRICSFCTLGSFLG